MLNTHALTNPTPLDINLRTTGDPLGMLCEGSYDSNRFSFFHGKHPTIQNATSNVYNHLTTTMGNYGQGMVSISALNSNSGYPLKQTSNHLNSVGNNNVLNTFMNPPVYPAVSHLVDSRLATPINPLLYPPLK